MNQLIHKKVLRGIFFDAYLLGLLFVLSNILFSPPHEVVKANELGMSHNKIIYLEDGKDVKHTKLPKKNIIKRFFEAFKNFFKKIFQRKKQKKLKEEEELAKQEIKERMFRDEKAVKAKRAERTAEEKVLQKPKPLEEEEAKLSLRDGKDIYIKRQIQQTSKELADRLDNVLFKMDEEHIAKESELNDTDYIIIEQKTILKMRKEDLLPLASKEEYAIIQDKAEEEEKEEEEEEKEEENDFHSMRNVYFEKYHKVSEDIVERVVNESVTAHFDVTIAVPLNKTINEK